MENRGHSINEESNKKDCSKEKRPIFIGGAWPYANGSLHVGQMAALLPGDVLARYFRQLGHPVLYVSGSDCHGTPISVRAAREQRSPHDVAAQYHQEVAAAFNRLGISYDCYSRTDQPQHHRVVQDIFTRLQQNGWLEARSRDQVWCPGCARFLPDRYVNGTCPHCHAAARGDQCDYCTRLLNPEDLLDPHCQLCAGPTELRTSRQQVFLLSKLQLFLEDELQRLASGYRRNAYQETLRYFKEGLQDRDASRDLDWGVPLPGQSGPSPTVYVWIDAVLGYLSASQAWSEKTGGDWRRFWQEPAQAWYVHGKDNIPFHTIILPALLQAAVPELKRPDRIISSEYMTLEGRKISTSANWAIRVNDLLERYPADSIRYSLLANGPEKRDADFSWTDFVHSHNGELVGAFGNFVQRTLVFIIRYRDGNNAGLACDPQVRDAIDKTYVESGNQIEAGEFKAALTTIFQLVHTLNRYFDQEKPWLTRHEQAEVCDAALATCLHGIANLSQLLAPFLPFSCQSIRETLDLAPEPAWYYIDCPVIQQLKKADILFPRIDMTAIVRERERLQDQKLAAGIR